MQQLLQDLGGRAERFGSEERLVEELTRLRLKRVRSPNGVHEDVGIDEGQTLGIPAARDASIARKCSSQSGSIPGASPGVAFFEEPPQVPRGFEPFDPLAIFETLTSGGPKPRAERQALLARLFHKPVAVLVGDDQLNSGHRDPRPACGYVYIRYTLQAR